MRTRMHIYIDIGNIAVTRFPALVPVVARGLAKFEQEKIVHTHRHMHTYTYVYEWDYSVKSLADTFTCRRILCFSIFRATCRRITCISSSDALKKSYVIPA